jgi:hypothetical protein
VGFKSNEMWHRVVGWVLSGESKDSNSSLQVPAVLAQPYPWRWSQNPSKGRKPITRWHSVAFQNTWSFSKTAGLTSNFATDKVYSFKYNQQAATLYNILYCCQYSTCFRRFFRPSSGAQSVHTSPGICQACLLLPLAWVSCILILYNVASCWLYLKQYINDARYIERQIDKVSRPQFLVRYISGVLLTAAAV